MKIGILGGTFDPVHKAHLELGRQAIDRFGLDRILIMPSGNSYFKTTAGHVTDAFYREKMVQLAIEDEPDFECSDMEIRRPGYTYTSDTMLELSREYPGAELFFIVGADSLHTMRRWYAPEVILRYASIIVADRRAQVDRRTMEEDRKYLEERYAGRIRMMDFSGADISSTDIRKRVRRGKKITELVPKKVAKYIREHHLYQEPLTMKEIDEDLQRRLKKSRYIHTLGVADTAGKLALRYGEDPVRARLAGMIHDCGKYEGTNLTHGRVGARIARNEYGITDDGILAAVTWHTTGHPQMTLLEKIIFTADYIEPNRDKAPRLPELRKMAYEDLDRTVAEILKDTIDYLLRSGTEIDNSSLQTYDFYRKYTEHTQGDR